MLDSGEVYGLVSGGAVCNKCLLLFVTEVLCSRVKESMRERVKRM